MTAIRYLLVSLLWPMIRQIKPVSEGAKARLQFALNPCLRGLKAFCPFITANMITSLRLPLGAAAWFYFYFGLYETAFWLVFGAEFTDALDGLWARANKEDPSVGRWLDPTVDKIVNIPLIGLVGLQGYITLWLAILMIVLDLVSAHVYWRLRHSFVSANWFGGSKKVLQDLCLIAIFGAQAFELNKYFDSESANALMGIACGFAFLTTWVKYKEFQGK